ncbi:hypothetical protein ACFSTH_14955 [Paenibacillus yanchengensis]|uniref:Uncharacterized protein n=1 Tax=Paenibacillus yanchengensis TaxID=2035833 RepID=A0ABW4YHV7_9BACL
MELYSLLSASRARKLEVKESTQGAEISLYHQDEKIPYYKNDIQQMLVYSTGRPWHNHQLQLTSVAIHSNEEQITIVANAMQLRVTCTLLFNSHDLLETIIEWENVTSTILNDVVVGVEWQLPIDGQEQITIPHVIYNNNPSADPDRLVPRLGVGTGQGLLCEEHRLPIPCVNMEWPVAAVGQRYFTLYSIPDYVECEDGTIHYGSIGAYKDNTSLTIATMSGALMFNGEKDIVYVSKSQIAPYDQGYLNFESGFTLKKHYVVDWGMVAQPGRAFVEVVHQAEKIFNVPTATPLTLDEMIRLKTAAMDDRWREAGAAAGYVKFNDRNSFGFPSKKHELHFMYGWTGQALKMAWCDAHLGFSEQQLERIDRCEKAVNFYVNHSTSPVKGLRHSVYLLKSGQWDSFNWMQEKVISSRAFGETISDLADIILLYRNYGREVPASWVSAVEEAAQFLLLATTKDNIFPAAFRHDGSSVDPASITAAGIPCQIALAKAYQVTNQELYLEKAHHILESYYRLHALTFERPFARSTLDARCEDKEAGMFFFLAAYEMFVLTKEERYQQWAEVAAEWQLTFVYVWNPVYDAGTSFAEANFLAAGWPGVSVQNHHLDVFFPTYEVWQLGKWTGNERFVKLAEKIFAAMGQGICTTPGEWGFTVVGEQAEGFFQSNFQGRGRSNTWNPSWIISEVLHHGLRIRAASVVKI